MQRLVRESNIPANLECGASGAEAVQWYHQAVLQYLVHPRTPIHRLLVVWQLGAGKTLGMIRVLENFLEDRTGIVL